jgi:hypothetical protein
MLLSIRVKREPAGEPKCLIESQWDTEEDIERLFASALFACLQLL